MVPNEPNILEITELNVFYNQIQAVHSISLSVRPGEIVTLIGANGSGKSTTLKTILGLHRAAQGRVLFQGRDITSEATDRIVASGLVLVPEGRGIVSEMSVRENLELGAYHRSDSIGTSLERVFKWFSILRERQEQTAGTLSGGQQQMLAIARAMMATPILIMMDEPSLGLAPIVVKDLFKSISRLRDEGQAILLSEQNANLALRIADRGYVFEKGACVLAGPAKDLINNDTVRKAYLGG